MEEKNFTDFKLIDDPSLIKEFSNSELKQLATQVRNEIIDKCSINGGHLSSNLGTVELTVALFKTLDLPKDKVIFDVGHQSYAYKILSGRNLDTLRKENGIDGFQKKEESIYDCYEAGHSSTSISAGMGFSLTRDLSNDDYRVVCIIGDSSLSNGLSFEAINNLNKFNHQLLIILNDNEMSITTPVGGLNSILRSIRVSKKYVSSKNKYKERMSKNKFLKRIYNITSKIKNFIVNLIYKSNLFEDLGLYYYGVVDGHNISKLTSAINKVKDIKGPVLLHIKTKKGKGYYFAEADNEGIYHSVNKFTQEVKIEKNIEKNFSKIYASLLDEAMEKDSKIISINPAMSYGSSLDELMKKYPQRAIDVGISEEHAVVFSSGIASNSYHPYVTIYSTFLQRSYDQISHDVARMNLPVTLMVDHCGLVGKDGETHQGIYDYAYLSTIPNMTIAMAKDENEARELFNFSLNYSSPLAIRYPLGSLNEGDKTDVSTLEYGQWNKIKEGSTKDVALVSFGPKIDQIKDLENNISIYNAIFHYPIIETNITSLLNYKNIIIYDPYGTENGFANYLSLKLYENGYKGNIKKICLPLEFIKKGTIEEQEKRLGVDIDSLKKEIEKLL